MTRDIRQDRRHVNRLMARVRFRRGDGTEFRLDMPYTYRDLPRSYFVRDVSDLKSFLESNPGDPDVNQPIQYDLYKTADPINSEPIYIQRGYAHRWIRS